MGFSLFLDLQKELQVRILSYVASAPFEQENYTSPLTHVLPMVSRQFRDYCNELEIFWQDALIRLIARDPEVWRCGLLQVSGGSNENDEASAEELIEHAVASTAQVDSCKSLLKQIVAARIWFSGPIFYMNGAYQMGEPIRLHFFEPRYRRLIRDVMANWPPEARSGERIEPIDGEMPKFVLVDDNVIQTMMPAFLVQVEHCVVYRDGRADVFLVPVEMVELHRFCVLPDSGHLYYGECRRVSKSESEAMEKENLKRQIQMMGFGGLLGMMRAS